MSGETVVSLVGIDKSFPNGVLALRGLSFDVRAGEFVSLLGPSGTAALQNAAPCRIVGIMRQKDHVQACFQRLIKDLGA